MATRLALQRDVNGYPSYGLPISVNKVRTTLAGGPGSEQHTTVPPNVDTALFTYAGGNVWVDLKGTATLPGATFNVTDDELNPVLREVTPGQTISVISDIASYVQISYYLLGSQTTGVS